MGTYRSYTSVDSCLILPKCTVPRFNIFLKINKFHILFVLIYFRIKDWIIITDLLVYIGNVKIFMKIFFIGFERVNMEYGMWREFQAMLDETRQRRAEGTNTPGVGKCSVQTPTFEGCITWSVFRRQFEVVAEQNWWSNQDKSTYLITALKGRAADVLPGIPTNTIYEDTLRALEDSFEDEHFVAAYRCQLTFRRQNARESLQDFATAIEMLALRAYPNLPTDYIAREAGKSFAYGISDADIKIQLLLRGEKTVNEALRHALELQAVLLAARPGDNNTKIYREFQSSPTQRRDTQQSRCWNCRQPGHFERDCQYGRRHGDGQRKDRKDGPPRSNRESPGRSEWRPGNNRETSWRTNQPSGNERRSAEKGERRRMH
jgi:hypothetical protein